MSISCQGLYEDIVQQLGLGSGNTRLASSFIRATNRALDQMSIRADLATRHTHISATNSSISTLDPEYEGLLYSGVYYWMVRMGHSGSDPRIATVQYKDSAEAWKEALGDYVMAESNDNQSDSGNDVIGLGSLE